MDERFHLRPSYDLTDEDITFILTDNHNTTQREMWLRQVVEQRQQFREGLDAARERLAGLADTPDNPNW